MSSNIVSLNSIKKVFVMGNETITALNDISFSINSGEFVSIMGSSGSGKTTLLNILGCLDRPSSGSYLLEGNDVSKLTKDNLAILRNNKIGFVFQSYNLLPRTSAIENVELPLLYNPNMSRHERERRSLNALKEVNLLDRIKYNPNQLSGGQQQRVAIARALVNDPILILSDEATGNLDTKTSYDIMMLFQYLNDEKGKTIIFITHELDIASFTKRTITLKDGKVINDVFNSNVRSAKSELLNLPSSKIT